jgi:hypothetical protein
MKTYGGLNIRSIIGARFLDLGASLRWLVSFTSLAALPPGEEPRYQMDKRLKWPYSRSGPSHRDNNPLVVLAIASNYTDYATAALRRKALLPSSWSDNFSPVGRTLIEIFVFLVTWFKPYPLLKLNGDFCFWTMVNIYQTILCHRPDDSILLLIYRRSQWITLYSVYLLDERNNEFYFLRFQVFTAVTMKNGVFWDVTPCGSYQVRWYFFAAYVGC